MTLCSGHRSCLDHLDDTWHVWGHMLCLSMYIANLGVLYILSVTSKTLSYILPWTSIFQICLDVNTILPIVWLIMYEVEGNWLITYSVNGNTSLYGIQLLSMDSIMLNKQHYFWQKMLLLITENEVVTLANEIALIYWKKKTILWRNTIEHKHNWKYCDWKYWVLLKITHFCSK